MAKTEGDTFSISETGNWNQAKFYSAIKIAKLLMEIDNNKKICYFGAEELFMEMSMNEDAKNYSRILALNRLVKTTQMLIANSIFALKNSSDVDEITEYRKIVNVLEDMIPFIKKEIKVESHNGMTKSLKINEDVFKLILDGISIVNEKILYPLNKNDLIFLGSEEYDVFERKKDFIRRASEMG